MVGVSNAGWEPHHFAILTMDIEGYGSPTRTDPIRAGLRKTLDNTVAGAVTKLGETNPMTAFADTGDGKWIIFDGRISKIKIITVLLPALEVELRHYNAAASSAARLRLRIGVHHGELIPDHGGYSGEALNHAFRIIDNGVVRQALKASTMNSIVAVSDDFFNKIIRPGYGALDPDSFAPVQVTSKETTTVAWINSAHFEPAILLHPTVSAKLGSGVSSKKVLTIADLPPASLYVPVTDIHNMRLYGRGFPGAPVQQHIEAALLLADKVAVHCADAYRSTVVTKVLESFKPCIAAGDFLFLLGENFQDPGTHFRGYIDYKVEQYRKSEYGKRDVASLTEVDKDAADRAEEFLRLSPYAFIRGFSGTDGFIRAAKEDLMPRETITIREHFATSIVGKLSLTIRQLLDLTRLGPDGALTRVVADDKTVGRLQVEINRLAGHNSFSRQTMMAAIRNRTDLGQDDSLDQIFEERVSLIHLMGTLGSLTHMQVTNRRDRLSPYYYGHLLDHLSDLAEVAHPITFKPALVLELRALPNWWAFAAYHLRLVSDATHRVAFGESATDLSPSYRWSRRIPEFEAIRSIVRHHWG